MDVRERDRAETVGPPDVAAPDRPATPEGRRLETRRVALWAPLGILLVLWLWLFVAEGAFAGGPNGHTFGADFAMFYSAGRMLQSGANPYDQAALYAHERNLLHRDRLPVTPNRAVVRVGNPPLFFWALGPLLRLRFQLAALVWGLALYAASALALWLLLVDLGYSTRLLVSVIFLAFPQVLLGAFYGNVAPLVLLGVTSALVLGTRMPSISGSILAVAWLKPPVALPLAMLIILFHAGSRLRAAAAFVITSFAFALLTVVVLGTAAVSAWVHALTRYSSDIATSPGIASAAGLYVRSVGAHTRVFLQLLSVAVALALSAYAWLRFRDSGPVSVVELGWLWTVWFLATPYAHIYDESLLAAPILALVLQRSGPMPARYRALVVYASFASLFVVQAAPHGIQLLPLPLVAVALCLALARPGRQPNMEIRRAVA